MWLKQPRFLSKPQLPLRSLRTPDNYQINLAGAGLRPLPFFWPFSFSPKSLAPRRGIISPVFSDSRTSVQTRKLIGQIYFMPATFRDPAYPTSMSTKTLPVTATSFEKVFAALATKRPHARRQGNALADWREIAWAALDRKRLGDALRRAIDPLSVKYREVLFLQDVKNLNASETAWVLGITVGAARSRLLQARRQVRDALASGLSQKSSVKNSDRGNSRSHDIPCNFRFPTLQNSFYLA